MLYKNKRIALLFLLSVFSGHVAMAQMKPATGSNKKVIFFDDFKENKLDRSKWNVEITGNHFNDELQAYVDSSATLRFEKGMMVFQPSFEPGFVTKDGQHFDFISTRLNTRDKFDFKYGTAEARIKISDGAGLWPAWWILGYDNWPATGEIDVMEYVGEKDWVSAAVHGPGYSGETPFVNRLYFDKNNDVAQWHVYAVDWTPDSLVFKYDGKPMFRVTRMMTNNYGKWAFDNKKFLILNFAVGGAYPAKINGVKKPYYGLPASTMDMIKNHKAKMYVDWVRVTSNE
ncbi:MAG: glycoside hydrolase family 16 protein [Bacteroidota bacterium]|nr:glycoside hydrolase family 16 protein [Bacteroidota bacterium]